MIDSNHGWNASFKAPSIGFVLSLTLIGSIYRASDHLSGAALAYTVLGLGATLVLIQLFFFLHVGVESKPHWATISFFFTLLVVIIIVGGSLWIMQNLNYNTMPTMSPP